MLFLGALNKNTQYNECIKLRIIKQMSYRAQKQLWVLTLLGLIGSIGISLPYPIFAPMLLHPAHNAIVPAMWPVSSHAIILGVLLAIYPLGIFLGSPVLGGLSDHYGRRKLIIMSLFGATLGYVLTALALHYNNLYLLLFTRFLTGFAESNVAILRSAVADMPDINKHHGFGLIGVGLTMGYIIGPPLGGILSDPSIVAWFNFATPFYLAAGIVLIAAFLAWIILVEPVKQENSLQLKSRSMKQRFDIVGQLRCLCNDRSLKLLYLAGFFFFLGVDTYYEFYPAFLVDKWGMQALVIALLTAVLSVGIAIGNAVLSRFYANRYAIMPTIFWHMLLYAAMIIITLLVSKILPLYIVFTVTGLFIGVTSNHFYVQISETAEEHQQGEALGMATGLRMLGDAGISLIGGFLIVVSSSLPLLGAIVMALIAAWIIFAKFLTAT